jgi:carbon storage regulator
MLVLTRRIEETIVIDGSIRIKVLGVQGDKVRIGIEAPASVTVNRQEVQQRRAEFAAYFGKLASAEIPASEIGAPPQATTHETPVEPGQRQTANNGTGQGTSRPQGQANRLDRHHLQRRSVRLRNPRLACAAALA